MRSAASWGGMIATAIFIGCLMFGCLGHAAADDMRECVEHMPYTVEPFDPALIPTEDDSDVDHCYTPAPNPDDIYET
jgi:hypothetical protein